MKKMSDWEIYQLARHKPRDAQELDFYCKAIFNMDIPKERSGYCKRHCRQCDPPFEALKSAYFAETPECGWIGGRGTSKTVMIALLTSIELLTLEIDVSIISGSKDQSSLILKYMRNQDTTLRGKLWGAQNAPKWLFNEREDAKYRLRTVEDKRDKESVGNEIVAHAAAESSIRGSHPLRCRLDEVDLAEWSHLETSRGLPTEDLTRPDARTHILYASTYHVYNGTMSRLIKELRAKGFPVFSWCVFEQMEENGGFITRRYLADKMRTMGKIKWDIEYMNNGPIAGIPILDAAMLNHRYDPSLGCVPGLPNIPWELTDTPSKMTRHYHGIDWAKAEHWTVFDTLIRAEKGFQQGAWYRTGRKPWPDISRDAARHIHRFLGPVAHDATGVGAAMDDWLVEHRVPRSRIMGVNWRKTTLIKEMATAYVGALQSGDIVGPNIEFARSEHEYLTEAMLYDDEHCPDSVAAAMMAYWVARQNNRRTSPRPMRIKVQ